jgi:trigger factor
VDPASFEEALVGARAGDERSLEFEFPPTFPLEAARGEKGRVQLRVSEVLRLVPPSDDELFRAFEATDEATLREAVRARMQAAKAEGEEHRIESELLERLIEAHAMELPEELVQEQVDAQQTELIERLKEQGMTAEEAAQRAGGERERARAGAEKGLRALYLIEEIARAKDLKLTQEEVAAELAAIATRNGSTPEEVARFYREQGQMRQLGLELTERKVRRYLRASAAIRMPA